MSPTPAHWNGERVVRCPGLHHHVARIELHVPGPRRHVQPGSRHPDHLVPADPRLHHRLDTRRTGPISIRTAAASPARDRAPIPIRATRAVRAAFPARQAASTWRQSTPAGVDVTTVAVGAVGSSGSPLFDLTFVTNLPNQASGPGAPLGATCASPPIITSAAPRHAASLEWGECDGARTSLRGPALQVARAMMLLT